MSQDPLGFDGGDTNLYRYVANAPMNGTDPTGTTMVEYQSSYVPSLALLNSASTASYVKSAEGGLALLAGIIATRVQAEARAREQSFFKLQAVSTQNTIGLGKVISTTYAFAYGMFELFTAGPDTETIDQQDGSVAVVLDKDLDKDLSVEGEKEQKKNECDPNNPVPLMVKEKKQKQHVCGGPEWYANSKLRNQKSFQSCFITYGTGVGWFWSTYKHPQSTIKIPSGGMVYQACFRDVTGYSGPAFVKGVLKGFRCVAAVVDTSCKFHSYPISRLNALEPQL